jgi:hypothetical protein
VLDETVAAHRSALEIYTKADLPESWARLRTIWESRFKNLGSAATMLHQLVGTAVSIPT